MVSLLHFLGSKIETGRYASPPLIGHRRLEWGNLDANRHSKEAARRSGVGAANRHYAAWVRTYSRDNVPLRGLLAQGGIASEPAVFGEVNLRPGVGRRATC